MENSAPFQSNEANLFEFHFTSAPAYDTNQHIEKFQPSLFQQPTQPYYSYYSDSTPTNHQSNPNPMFSSPQLKPANSLPHQRKRFKTLVPSKHAPLLSPNSEKDKAESENAKDDDDDEDDLDGETGSDTDSNQEGDSNAKRGKYKIYTDQEKSTIINFMMKHGMQKTLEIFSGNTHKITKRKLKSWLDGQFKVKGVKGRKTNDPNRDQALYDWCLLFQQDYGRAPTRKEATKKALEISEDATFQASKGWLDKFSRKFNIEFTPLKIIPVKNRKKVDGFLLDNDSLSSASGSDTSVEGISPLIQSMQTMQMQPNQQPAESKPWGFESQTKTEYSNFNSHGGQVNSYFSNNQPQQQHNNYGGMSVENKNMMGPSSFEPNYYHQPAPNTNYYNHQYGNNNNNNNNNHYPMNFQQQQQQPYQMNPDGNFQLDYIYLPNNQNQNQNQNQNHAPDMGNFFNTGGNYDADRFLDDHMKMEHPY